MRLFLILLAVPVIEIGLFIEIGGWLGTWPTIGLVVLTALIGSILLRQQGLAAMREAQSRLAAGEDPGRLLADGAMILVAGALLLTPGFFTDAVGFLLLVPGVRTVLWTWMRKHIKVAKKHLVFSADEFLNIIKTSLGGIGQMVISMTAWIFLMRILSEIGSAAVAGATITIRFLMFTLMPAWGFANAAATLVGQNLGADRPDRAESAVWRIGWINMVYLILVSFVFYFLSEQLMGFFSTDPEVITIGAEWLRILSYAYFVYGWWMVSVQAFNGAGDTRTPTLINLVFFWAIQIPLSYYLALDLGWAHSGVFWGVLFSEASVGLFTLWLFSRGSWKKAKV